MTRGVADAQVVVTGPNLVPDVALLGAKAANLVQLDQLGFPVPPLSVVTTDAYRAVARSDEVRAALEAEPCSAMDAERRRIDQAFLTAPLPVGLERKIRDAVTSLEAPGEQVVVRSSATAEDLAGASFAGQYRSFVGVQGAAEVLRAVRLVWASLWHPAPRRYRAALGLNEGSIEMAVLLMPLIPAVKAGVVFTVDPNGDADDLKVEMVDGPGELLVSGEVTPGAWSLPRAEVSQRAPDALVEQIAHLALEIERALGRPQDIEWAWDGALVHVLQARPISVSRRDRHERRVNGDDTREGHRFSTAGIAEMLPGVIPPLVWGTIAPLVDDALVALFVGLGAPVDTVMDGVVSQRQGRALVDVTALEAATATLPGAAASLVPALESGEHRVARRRRPKLRDLRHDVRVARVRRSALHEAELFELAVPFVLDAQVDPRLLDDAGALTYRARLADLLARGVRAEVAVAAAAVASFGSLEAFLARYLGASAARAAVTDLARRTAPAAADQWLELARQARSLPAGRAMLSSDDWTTALAHLHEGHRGAGELRAQLDRTLRRSGSRSIAGGATWEERPDLAWRAIVATHRRAERPADFDPGALRSLLVATPRWQRLLMLTGFVADPQGILLGHHVEESQLLLTRRESLKRTLLALGGEVRRLHLDLGRRLVERGQLEERGDVDLLYPDELGPALRGTGISRAEVLRRRRALDDWTSEVGPLTTPDGTRGPPTAHLSGWAASAGTHVGPVRVVHLPDEPVEPGDVVVARTTDSSWVPVFLEAGALVVEQGGPLSHAAIVARELGLPAVVNVPGVVARFSRGPALVRVDGTSGEISILEEAR